MTSWKLVLFIYCMLLFVTISTCQQCSRGRQNMIGMIEEPFSITQMFNEDGVSEVLGHVNNLRRYVRCELEVLRGLIGAANGIRMMHQTQE